MLSALSAGSEVLKDIWLGKWDSACYQKRELQALTFFSHTLRSAFSQDQRISENMTCMSTPRQSRQEKLPVVWTSATMLVWHHRELGEGGCRSQGPGSRHLPAPRPPWLPSSWASPFGAKMMAAGLGSLFSRRRVHRQKMAVCPGSSP